MGDHKRSLFQWATGLHKFFRTSHIRPHGMTNNNQILHGDGTRQDEHSYKVDHVTALGKTFCATYAC